MIQSGLGKMRPSFKCFMRASFFVLALSLNPICKLFAASDDFARLRSVQVSHEDTSVRVDLILDAVNKFDTNHLPKPPRWYVDLRDTVIDPQLEKDHYVVEGPLLRSIRWSQNRPDVTRVVFGLQAVAQPHLGIESNPPRLQMTWETGSAAANEHQKAVKLLGEPIREGDQVLKVVNAHYVRVRSIPEIAPGNIVGKVAGGTQMRLLQKNEDWYQVELPDGGSGWIHSDFAVEDSARTQLIVTASVARIRSSNNTASKIVGKTIQGVRLDILDQKPEWYMVRLPQREKGWIHADLVKIHSLSPQTVDETHTNVAASPLQPNSVGESAANIPSAEGAIPAEKAELKKSMPIAAEVNGAQIESLSPDQQDRAEIIWIPDNSVIILLSAILGLLLFLILSSFGLFFLLQRDLKTLQKDPPLTGKGGFR